jgi:hypothetical protein
MRIFVQEHGEKPIRLIFPTGMIFNRLTALIGSHAIKEHAGEEFSALNSRQLNRLFRVIRKFKRKHPKFELVNVESSDGDKVRIIL